MSKARDIADLDTAELAGGAGSGLDADKLDGQQGAYYTAYADTAISNLVDSSPASLNTLNELAAALGDDVNFSTTVTDSIALKAPLASPTFTGTVTTAAISGTTGQFSGEITANGGIALGDNDKATFGASDDLQIYHDGSHSYVGDYGTGNLSVTGNNLYLQNTSGETYLSGISDGAVSLYHNNAIKLATTATGIDVGGNLTMATGGSIVAGGANDLILNAGESGTPDLYLQSGGSTKVKIEGSNGNVGIGIAPTFTAGGSRRLLQLTNGASGGQIAMGNNASESENPRIFSDADNLGFATATTGGGIFQFYTGGTEAMRISSGNVLVSTTSDFASGTVDGILAQGTNKPAAAFSNTAVGQIVKFYEGGSLAGSIGTPFTGELYIGGSGANSSGLLFTSGNTIQPRKNDAADNGNIDLGTSGNRFKDAYLSGGIYLGGTGAANKISDFETGTWSPVTGPTSTTATYVYRSGYYTKVGTLVTCYFGLKHNGGVWTGGEATISGLPFTVDTTGAYQEPQFIVTAVGLLPTGQGGSSASGSFNIGEVGFYLSGTQGRGRSYVSNGDTVMGGNAVFATNSYIKATIIYHSS